MFFMLCLGSGTLTERVYVYRRVPSDEPSDLEEIFLEEEKDRLVKQEKTKQQHTSDRADDQEIRLQ
jgi:hypothetical protein